MYRISLARNLGLAAAALCLLVLPSLSQAQKVVATVPVGFESDPAVNPVTGLVYFSSGNTIQVYKEEPFTPVGIIPVDTAASGGYVLANEAIDPVTNRLYVGGQNVLYVIDGGTGRLITTVNVNAVGVAVNFLTNKIYVSDFNSNVFVIDGRTDDILKDIPLTGQIPENLAVNPVTNRVYVAENDFPGQVTVIDGANDKVLTNVATGGYLSFGVAVDYLHNRVYSADELGTVGVIDGATNTLVTTINAGGSPAAISVDPLRRRVYLGNEGLNEVQVIDGTTNKIVKTVPVGSMPEYSDIDYLRGLLYESNFGDGTASVLKLDY